jgi:ABC-type multidrug transport system fused ATPase/permease subunit
MTNLRFNRDTKAFVSSRDDVFKLDRKSRVKKTNKNKIAALRVSFVRDSRQFSASTSEFESSQSESQQLVVNSFVVAFVASIVSIAFVASIVFVVSVVFVVSIASIVFVSIDNATLLNVLFQMLSFSSDANSFLIDSITTFVVFVVVSIATFVVSVVASIATFEVIEIVDDSSMNDIDALLKNYDRAQTKLL